MKAAVSSALVVFGNFLTYLKQYLAGSVSRESRSAAVPDLNFSDILTFIEC